MGNLAQLMQRIASVERTQLYGLCLAEARALLADVTQVRAFLDHKESEIVSAISALTSSDGPAMAELEIGFGGRRSKQETRQALARSHVLEQAPGFAAALEHGRVTASHVDALARALKKLNPEERDSVLSHETDLLRHAVAELPDTFAKHVAAVGARANKMSANERFIQQQRSSYFKHWTDAEGMVQLRGALDPERGEVLIGRLTNAVEAMFHSNMLQDIPQQSEGVDRNDHLKAHALMALTAVEPVATQEWTNSVTRAEVSVVVDLKTLQKGLHKSSVCRTETGQHLPVDVVRRLACESDVIPIVLDGCGVPIDVGRSKRLATRPQRKALAAVHESCAVPDCTVPYVHCVPHHIQYWENGGTSDLNNLVPLCSRHHHAVHEGGWSIALGPDRSVTVTLPDGRVL